MDEPNAAIIDKSQKPCRATTKKTSPPTKDILDVSQMSMSRAR